MQENEGQTIKKENDNQGEKNNVYAHFNYSINSEVLEEKDLKDDKK